MFSWQYLSRLWPLILPILVLLPGVTGFPYPSPEADYSDIVISHFPNAIYLQNSISKWQVLPLWSPTILSGYPFAANPLSGIWYPPGWLALLFPLPLGFNLMVLFHLLVGGLGMYILLRVEGISHPPALFGGMAFVALPKLYAHYGAGHLSLMYALTWTPWLLYWTNVSLNRVIIYPSKWKQLLLPPLQPALIFVLICLADIRWAGYAIVLWWVYALACPSPVSFSAIQISARLRWIKRLSYKVPQLGTLLGQSLIAFLIVAPLAFSIGEYVHHSTRSSITVDDFFIYSLPISRLLGLFFPDFGGFHEWVLYPGVVVLFLAFLAVLWAPGSALTRFWTAGVLFTLIYSLGSNFPALSFLAQLPVLSLLRVPSRALFLTGMALIVLASIGLERILAGPSEREKRRAVLGITAIVFFMVLLTVVVGLYTSSLPFGFMWGAGFALVIGIGLILKVRGRLNSKLLVLILLILALLDSSAVNFLAYSPRSTEEVLSEKIVIAEYLQEEEGLFRIYSPSYSIPQQTSVLANLQLVDGVDPLQIEAYAQFMEDASGVPGKGYSVTLPPFENGGPSTANVNYSPDPYLLGLLNTRFVVAEYDLKIEGLKLVNRFDRTRIYENKYARPRAWVQSDGEKLSSNYRAAKIIDWQPNQIRIQAQGPGVLVLSEIVYPNWDVWVDGQASAISSVAGLFRAVQLEDGTHEIVFAYRPISLYWGLALMGLGVIWVICILWVVRRWTRRIHER